MRKVLIVKVPNGVSGKPAFERVKAFESFYKKNGIEIIKYDYPTTILASIKFLIFVKKNSVNNILLSMPPFRKWYFFLFLKNKIILDIRDGWSIAIETGYGGIKKPQKIKSLIAKNIENFAIKQSKTVITCTPGLQKYLSSISNYNPLLILNGISERDYQFVSKIKKEINPNLNLNETVFVCTGKFSEYGVDKVKDLFVKISQEFIEHEEIIFKLIGANEQENKWVFTYLKSINSNIKFFIIPRLSKEKLYKEIINSNYAVAIIRDPQYDFGTKVFDYIICEVPIYNYFEDENPFSVFFKDYFSDSYVYKKQIAEKYIRSNILNRNRDSLLDIIT